MEIAKCVKVSESERERENERERTRHKINRAISVPKIMKEILYREIRRHASNEKQTTSENLNLSARYKS